MNITTATAQGARPYQEDRFFVNKVKDGTLLGVFDGHGGSDASEVCSQQFTDLYYGQFSATFERLAELTSGYHAGTTASVVFIPFNGRDVTVAVIGDSPVLVRDKAGALWVGPDHNVRSNLAERAAAIERGGFYYNGYVWTGIHGSGLQMGRSLGDSRLGDVLSREPEIETVQDISWVLVATDGVFDPAHAGSPTAEIAALVDAGADAQTLVDRAVNLPTHDNATAILVRDL